MIGLGVNTMIWAGSFTSSVYALLPRLREWGFTSVEIPVFDFEAFDAGSVRREVGNTGLALTVSTALPSDLHIARPRTTAAPVARTVENFEYCEYCEYMIS